MSILPHKNLRIALRSLAIVLGAVQAWLSRFDLVNDTVSYLDMGDRFFHGHISAIVNGLWGPLYAFLLGLTLTLFRPTIYSEYPAVHFLLFLLFCFTLACFEFFIRQLFLLRNICVPEKSSTSSDRAWIVICYVFFLWSTIYLIGVNETNPDMLVAGFVYLASGLLAKIAAGRAGWRTFASLGLIIGLSYLTKAVMFPVSVIILISTWLIAKQEFRRVLLAVAMFVLVAVPFIAALSLQRHHITFGESGKYNYAVHVDHVPRHHWQGEDPSEGIPVHPTRKIFATPPTFEFKDPIPGTYPVWYDPAYWYDGVEARIHPREQLRIIVHTITSEFDTFFYAFDGAFFISLVLAFAASSDKLTVVGRTFRLWFLIVPSLCAVLLYAPVHYELRYVGGFFGVLGIVLFSCVLWTDSSVNRRLFDGIAALQLLLILCFVASPLRPIRLPWHTANGSYQDVAMGAETMGLRPGDAIASLNFSNLGTAMWARLARLRIVSEVYYWPGGPEGSNSGFWSLDTSAQEQLLQGLSKSGARAVVSSDTPTGVTAPRWLRIGNTGWYLLWINSGTPQLPHSGRQP